jgi:hypothetical protein
VPYAFVRLLGHPEGAVCFEDVQIHLVIGQEREAIDVVDL